MEKIFFIKRFGEEGIDKKDLSNYLINRWAVTHAMGLTSWLFPVLYGFSSDNSCLRNLFCLPIVIVITVAFVLGAAHGILLLTEAETVFVDDYFKDFVDYEREAKKKIKGPIG